MSKTDDLTELARLERSVARHVEEFQEEKDMGGEVIVLLQQTQDAEKKALAELRQKIAAGEQEPKP